MRLAYIQVGGRADGAADAAPSPARCARGRRSQAHAPTDKQNKTERKRGGRGAVPADPLCGSAAAFPAAHGFLSSGFYVAVSYRSPAFRYEHFGSSFITSGLTCPMYSPSIQQEKLSKRSIFLSSNPKGQTISSSMMSVTKY